jgi:hypothetical protein
MLVFSWQLSNRERNLRIRIERRERCLSGPKADIQCTEWHLVLARAQTANIKSNGEERQRIWA